MTANPGNESGHSPRMSWGVADQALSSLTNFGVGVFAARTLDVESFGAFGLAYLTYGIFLSASRALHADPFTILYSTSRGEGDKAVARCASSAVLVGAVAGLVCAAASLFLNEPLSPAVLALLPVMPGLLLQDLWRYIFFANREGRSAFLNDLVWAVAQAVAFFVVAMQGWSSPATLILAWGSAATVAALIGIAQSKTIPHLRQSLWWLSHHADLAVRFVGEVVIRDAALVAPVFVAGAVVGLDASAGFRGADILLGPGKIVVIGAMIVALPEATRLVADPKRLRSFLVIFALATAVVGVANGVIAALLPESVGRVALGDSWESADRVVAILGIALAGIGVEAAASIGLRARAAAKAVLRARILGGAVAAVLLLIGAVIGTSVAIATAAATATWATAAIYWFTFSVGPAADSAQPGPSSVRLVP